MFVYGFQITPGRDDPLGYCESSAAAYSQALEHRREIKHTARLDPTAVYEIQLAEVTAETLIDVLNARDSMSDVLILSKRVLGFVTRIERQNYCVPSGSAYHYLSRACLRRRGCN